MRPGRHPSELTLSRIITECHVQQLPCWHALELLDMFGNTAGGVGRDLGLVVTHLAQARPVARVLPGGGCGRHEPFIDALRWRRDLMSW